MKHLARKRFGQHFLTDEGVLHDIVAAIDPRPGQALVEIGPGLAALTQPVLARCGQLTVIELDRDLAARLHGRAGLQVVQADVLNVDFTALAASLATSPDAPPSRLRVIGNLPYNISSPILFHLLRHVDVVRDQHFMLQKEVVDRMAATPGHKAFGRLSVMLQWRYRVQALFDVPPTAFDPPPRVDSAVVRMVPHATPAAVDAGCLSEMVQVAFSQRRKLLRHTLGRWLDQQGYAGDFDVQRRAEEVPVQAYVDLCKSLERN